MEYRLKLGLGTVQFGLNYGINNSSGIPENDEIKKIFTNAYESGIQILDTAPGYGDAEIKIQQLSGQKFKVVTKFPVVNNPKDLIAQLNTSLGRLKSKTVYGYLAHNSDNLLEYPALWETLLQAKEKKQIEKIGYSLYSCDQLERLLSLNMIPDLVQLPYSLLDRKFEIFLPQLKKLGTEIHVRSVFLQGLYYRNSSELPEKLEKLKHNIDALVKCCKKFDVAIGALALNFVLDNKYIDHAIIGVDSALQLNQNIQVARSWKQNEDIIECVNQIKVEHSELLNPANW
ncbi:MAG: aldo/keto reductase [Bacteroidia bacterium]